MRILASLLLLTAASSARADSGTPSSADELFEQGRLFMAAGKYDVACRAFDDSQAASFSVATELNQGNCREKNGQLATAWQLFANAAQRTNSATAAADRKLHDVAAERAARLVSRVSSFTLVVPAASRLAGLQITCDGAVPPLDVPIALDGGPHTVVATAPDHERFTITLSLASEHDARRIEIPALVPTPRPPVVDAPTPAAPFAQTVQSVPAPAPAPDITPPQVRAPVAHRDHHSLGPAVVAGIGALSLFGTGLALELSARDTYASSKVEVDDTRQHDLWQRANHQRYAAEGLAAAGVVVSGLALYLALHDPEASEPRPLLGTRTLGVDPVVGPTRAGLQLSGSF